MSNSAKQLKSRDPYIDILRAIGIISIVIGHGGGYIAPLKLNLIHFVYLYHLMIFFFIAGFCFKKEYSQQIYTYIGKRVKSLTPMFIGYSILFTLLHNYLLACWMLDRSQHFYSWDNILSNILTSFSLWSPETMLGAFWFIPVYLVANCTFGIVFTFAEKQKHPVVFHVLFTGIFAVIGLYIHHCDMYLNYHIQTSFIGIPVTYLGYFVKCHWSKIKRLVNYIVGVLCALVLYLVLSQNIGTIELAKNQIISPALFYPVTIIGIYFCMALAKAINRFAVSRKLFAYIGQNTYHIMALHFVSFKIVDYIYGSMTQADYATMSPFPTAYSFLWPLYHLAGVFLPLTVITIVKHMKKTIQVKLKHS